MKLAIDGRLNGRPPLRSLTRNTLRDGVYDGLREMILQGGFEPGEALAVRRLAAAFGTSPTPVREAMQQLVAENALTAEPNRAYRISRLSQESFLEVRDMRAELEGLAARKAATEIKPAEIRRLESAVARMDKAIDEQDLKTYLATNQAFHFIIYDAANSPILLRTIRMLWMQIGPSLNMLISDIELVEGLQDNHCAAVAAFKRADPSAACAAIRQDILDAGTHVGDQLATPA